MSLMNINEIYETLQGVSLSDISAALSRLDEHGHALTQTEVIWLAVVAVTGLLLCLFGLKIVRFWAAILGLAAGFFVGFAAAEAVGADAVICVSAGLATGILLALLGSVLYRVGVFVTVFLSVSLFCFHLMNPENWILIGICQVIGLVAAIFAMKFLEIITIFATVLLGAVTAGPAVCFLLPGTGMDNLVRIALCTLFGAVGVLVQLLLVSKKRKKQNLKRAAEIRQESSTANEVERARAVMADLGSDSAAGRESQNSAASSGRDSGSGLETISLDDIEDIDDSDEEPDDL